MPDRIFWLVVLLISSIAIPRYNPHLTWFKALAVIAIPALAVLMLTDGLSILSTRGRLIRKNMLCGAVVFGTAGVLLGWEGGVTGGPSGLLFGVSIYATEVGLGFWLAVLGLIAGVTAGVQSSRQVVKFRNTLGHIPPDREIKLDKPTALAALGYSQKFARDKAAHFFAMETLRQRRHLDALPALVHAAALEIAEFRARGSDDAALVMSQPKFAIMKIVGVEHLGFDWSVAPDKLKKSALAAAQSDDPITAREARQYLEMWPFLFPDTGRVGDASRSSKP